MPSKKVYFEKSQQMTTKVLNSSSVQRVITFLLLKLVTFLRVCLLNKRMPDSKKKYPCVQKIKNKDEQTRKLKRKKKKNEMLLDANPYLLSGQDSLLSIRLSRNCDFFMHKSNYATI